MEIALLESLEIVLIIVILINEVMKTNEKSNHLQVHDLILLSFVLVDRVAMFSPLPFRFLKTPKQNNQNTSLTQMFGCCLLLQSIHDLYDQESWFSRSNTQLEIVNPLLLEHDYYTKREVKLKNNKKKLCTYTSASFSPSKERNRRMPVNVGR